MHRHRSATSASLIILLGLLFSPLAVAQEEAPAEVETNRIGNFYLDLEAWVSQPTGLQYVSATEISGLAQANVIELDHGTASKTRYGVEWQLPKEFGTLRTSIYKHTDEERLQQLSPSNFIFGEVLNHPLYAGVNNDGRADGFAALANTRLRDIRIEFRRQAFRSPRVSADWFVGWRRVEHSRSHSAEYYGLVPAFPPLLPPGGFCALPCKLDPRPDTASVNSSFEGRGATIGIELEFPLWKNRVVLEGDLAVSLMRGDTRTGYSSRNWAYVLDTGSEFILLGPPYDEFDDVLVDGQGNSTPLLPFISQLSLPIGLSSDLSTSAQVYDASLGFRWRTPYKRLEVYGGIRQTHYNNVGADLRPRISTTTFTEDGAFFYNIEDIQQVERSVTYEGLYGGLRFRLY